MLSAMNYIKNNKRRVSVLVVSLSLFFIVTYLTNAILSTTTETFKSLLMENTKKIQYITISPETFGLDKESIDDLEFQKEYRRKYIELSEELIHEKGVKDILYSQCIYSKIQSVVGRYYYEIPCVEAKEIKNIMEHMNVVLKEGKIPENPGEVIIDSYTAKNQNFQIGDNIYSNDFKIVGIVDSNLYFGCGVKVDNMNYKNFITILSDGSIEDFSLYLNKVGYSISNDDEIFDYSKGVDEFETKLLKIIDDSTSVMYIGIIIVFSICIIAVYSIYLRDRYSEWCLYYSIGFSRKEIYFSIFRELIFTFILALMIGGVICIASTFIIDKFLVQSLGLKFKYFHLDTIIQILSANIIILGLLQIPIRFALFKISTVDAIDEDLI